MNQNTTVNCGCIGTLLTVFGLVVAVKLGLHFSDWLVSLF